MLTTLLSCHRSTLEKRLLNCHVWAKADFITYYEDAQTRRPVKWVFYTGN